MIAINSAVRKTLINAAIALSVFASCYVLTACSSTPSSSANSIASGIGSWRMVKHETTYLIKLRFPTTTGSQIGNQFLVSSREVGAPEDNGSWHTVRFSIVRDAGTFDCEGHASAQSGYGTVTAFHPNASFARAEVSHFPNLTQADLLKLALFDIDRSFIASAVKANTKVTVAELVVQKMTARYAAVQQ